MRKTTVAIFQILIVLCIFSPAYPAEPRTAVVLGYYPADEDAPDVAQTARILKAAQLYASGTVDTIMVTGGYTRGHISEARMGKIALAVLGVPPEKVLEEDRSATTIENGLFTGKLFDALGRPKEILLVSQKFHLMRAVPIFRENKFKVVSAPAQDSPVADWQLPPPPAPVPPDAASATLIIVYEPYSGETLLEAPDEHLARRLRAAYAAFRAAGTSRHVVLYSNWHTRGPIDPAEVMKIGLVTLGVKTGDITVEKHVRYGSLPWLLEKYGGTNALLIAPPGTTWDKKTFPDVKWTLWPVD